MDSSVNKVQTIYHKPKKYKPIHNESIKEVPTDDESEQSFHNVTNKTIHKAATEQNDMYYFLIHVVNHTTNEE